MSEVARLIARITELSGQLAKSEASAEAARTELAAERAAAIDPTPLLAQVKRLEGQVSDLERFRAQHLAPPPEAGYVLVSRYLTSDGKLFELSSEAEAHAAALQLSRSANIPLGLARRVVAVP